VTGQDVARRPVELVVYYDGACPVCAREIAAYQRQRGADGIQWVDAARCEVESLGRDLDRGEALARLHARRADGTLVAGAAAFAAIWRRLPALAWLGRIASAPVVRPLLDAGYAAFLGVRRLWRVSPTVLPRALAADLRTDHAGEIGAVMTYRGVLALTRDPRLRRRALRHLATARRHLASLEAVLPGSHRSLLLPLWRAGGWLFGALAALAGPRAVYATIEAVGTSVDRQYAGQTARIDRLDPERRDAQLQSLRAFLESCRRDEGAYRGEAASRQHQPKGIALRLWASAVGGCAGAAVALSRRI